jgi:hypothetical protein
MILDYTSIRYLHIYNILMRTMYDDNLDYSITECAIFSRSLWRTRIGKVSYRIGSPGIHVYL